MAAQRRRRFPYMASTEGCSRDSKISPIITFAFRESCKKLKVFSHIFMTVEPTLSESFRERHMWTAPKCATTALLKAIQERFLMFAPFYECRVKDKFPSQKVGTEVQIKVCMSC